MARDSGWMAAVPLALARAATAVACISLVGMALVEGWQVFARYVLNDSPSWTEPVALLFMSAAMMCGAAVAVRSDSHFGFFLAVLLMPPPVRRVVQMFGRLVVTAIGLVLAYWGGVLMVDGWVVPMAAAPLPQGLVFLPICVGGALIALFAAEKLLHETGGSASAAHSAPVTPAGEAAPGAASRASETARR
jgi:TRAP-type C4-dicarboxylate transport system permease small subunit